MQTDFKNVPRETVTAEELWLYSLCKKNGINITDIKIRQLSFFKNLLLDWNKKINLISRKNEERIWKDHIVSSLSILFKIEFPPQINILDLGTGGGLPGIPLSILLPHCSFLLLDSTQKKITAVQSMIDSLSIPNVKAIWGRAEELQQYSHLRQTFDVVVARSVSSLTNLLNWGLPFLKTSSSKFVKTLNTDKVILEKPSLITFKGGEIEKEKADAKKNFPKVKLQTIPLTFHGSEEFENQDKKLVIATL